MNSKSLYSQEYFHPHHNRINPYWKNNLGLDKQHTSSNFDRKIEFDCHLTRFCSKNRSTCHGSCTQPTPRWFAWSFSFFEFPECLYQCVSSAFYHWRCCAEKFHSIFLVICKGAYSRWSPRISIRSPKVVVVIDYLLGASPLTNHAHEEKIYLTNQKHNSIH